MKKFRNIRKKGDTLLDLGKQLDRRNSRKEGRDLYKVYLKRVKTKSLIIPFLLISNTVYQELRVIYSILLDDGMAIYSLDLLKD